MLSILLLFLAQTQLTDDSLFVIGDPYIDNGYVYFQASTEVLTSKTTNDMGTLYTYAHSNPELTTTVGGETFELELPEYADTMIISGALSRIERALDGAWLIAVGDKEGYTYLWRYQHLEPEYLGSILIPNPTQITALSFSYQATKVLIGTEYGRVFRYNIPIAPWVIEYTSDGWHPEDNGYTKLYPIYVQMSNPGRTGKRDALLEYGAGLTLRLTSLGNTPSNDCLIVHVTRNPGGGVQASRARIWVLTKGVDPGTVANNASMTLYDLPGYGPTDSVQKLAPSTNTQPLLFTFDTLYQGGTLGRSAMTCLSVNDATYYKLNLDDGYTTPYGGMNIFYREVLSGKVRYWGAYRTETPGTYALPDYVYKYMKTQNTFNLCDGNTYRIYTWRNAISGIDVESRPAPFFDDTIEYTSCEGTCPGYVPIDESKIVASDPNWAQFELAKEGVNGVSYDVSLTASYNSWVFIETDPEETYNNLFMVVDYVAFCASYDCGGATYIDINLLENENFGETIMYVPLVPQACNPYCLKITTRYTDRPILELSTQQTDYVRINQKVLRDGGAWGFSPDRWTEEFSITDGNRKSGSLDWKEGTWTVEWPTGKGFDVGWYSINLLDPSLTIEGEGESPLTEFTRKSGQIGPFVRVEYYKTSDGFYSIVKDGDDADIIQVPGNIDIFDIITKERPYVVYRRTDVPGDDSLLGTYITNLDAIIVYWDETGTYFLGENPPDCVDFEVDSVTYYCVDGFLGASDLRFFDYPGDMPPGIYPDCETGQDCITAAGNVSVWQSPVNNKWYMTDITVGAITQDHCGVIGENVADLYNPIAIIISSPSASQLAAAQENLGENVSGIATEAFFCHYISLYPTSLILFFLTSGPITIVPSGTFEIGGVSFAYDSHLEVPDLETRETSHEDLLDEICVPDDCYVGGTDCITIPTNVQVFAIPEVFKTSGTWDDGYDYALTSKEPLGLTEDHCFTRGLAFPGRSSGGKYVAYKIFADNATAEAAYNALYDSHRGDQATHSSGGDVLLAYVERIDNRVYVYTLCASPLPMLADTVTFGTNTFTSFAYGADSFEVWTFSKPIPETMSCISSATQIFKLDQTAKEYEGEIVSSKVDLTGYDEVVGQRDYFSTDETLIDIPWGGRFYDIMWLSPTDDYEIIREFSDVHYVSPQFSQEGETVYEKEVDVDYSFAAVEDYTEGEFPIYHTEGEIAYVGGYPVLPGEPAELYVMEGEATEGEIFAVPECTIDGDDCLAWDPDSVVFQTQTGGYCVSVPGIDLSTPSPYTERHCGLGPIYPSYTKTKYTITLDNQAGLVDDYTLMLGHNAIGAGVPSGSILFLARVEVSGADLLLYVVHLTRPKDAYFIPTGSISFGTLPVVVLSSLNIEAPFTTNAFEVYTYDFADYEIDQLCILGAYTERTGTDASGDNVYRSPMGAYNMLSSTNNYAVTSAWIYAKDTNTSFIPAGTTKLKTTLTDGLPFYDLFDGMLGRNFADTPGEYYIFAHIEVSGNDLIFYFLNIGGIAAPVSYFVNFPTFQLAFGDFTITSATGEFYVYKYVEKRAPYKVSAPSVSPVAANGCHIYIDDTNQGYAFNVSYPALEYARGVGDAPYTDWEKVYIDYANVGNMTGELNSRISTPYLGWRQTSGLVDHFIAGYELVDNSATVRVFFLVSPDDDCTDLTSIAIGGLFPAKTAADRGATDFYIVYYDAKTSGNPVSGNLAVPYPPEIYGWDCASTEGAFIYRNYTNETWLVSSDTVIVDDYRTPVIGLKDDITAGFIPYSRTYGPYLEEREFNERYALLVQNLGLNLRPDPDDDPAVLTHLRKVGNTIKVFYLINGSSALDAYTLGGYEFPMSLLSVDDDFDLIAYDYPLLPGELCKDWYSKKIDSTENFTVDNGYTSSTVDLRGYTDLSQVTFPDDTVPLYYNLSMNNVPEYNIFLPTLYSVPDSFTDAYIYDYTWNHEVLSTVFYKDMNLFGTALLPPLYNVYPGGGTTETRFDDYIAFRCTVEASPTNLAARRAYVGQPITLSWDGGSTQGIMVDYAYAILYNIMVVAVPKQWDVIEHPLTVLDIESNDSSTGFPISSTSSRMLEFDCAFDKPLGYGSITSLIGTTTQNGIFNAFYKEDNGDSTWHYYVGYYLTTAPPANITSVTWADSDTTVLTAPATVVAFNAARTYANTAILITAKEMVTPATWTYDLLDTTYQDPGLFTKQVNIVEYTDYLWDGGPLVLNDAVPEAGYRIIVDEAQYLRFDPRTRTISDSEEGETLASGDLYVSPVQAEADLELYVNFGIQEDVSEASPGYNSIYIGEDVHILERCKGPERPINYASFGWCTGTLEYDGLNQGDCISEWDMIDIDKEDLYAHTYEHQDYTIFMKDGFLYAHPSEGYLDPDYTWITTEPEAFDLIMEWIDASEAVKEFFRVYLGVPGSECQNGTWEDPFEIPTECDNVVTGLDVSALLGNFDDAYNANVIIDDFTVDEGVQKFWVVDDTSHLGLPAFMTVADFDAVCAEVADEYDVADPDWFTDACEEMWYYQTVPVGHHEYYWETDGNLSAPFNAVRIRTYLPLIAQIVPTNVALECLRMQLQDWQRPNLDRLSVEAPTASALRNSFINVFLLRNVTDYGTVSGAWGLINIMEPVAFSAPLVVYLLGNGQIVVNNVWGTTPMVRFTTDAHVGESYTDVVLTANNNLTIKGPKRLYYGALAGSTPMSPVPSGAVPNHGRLESNTVVFDSNKAFITGNLLDPWAQGLYRFTMPSGDGMAFTWPREFMSSSNYPWDDPPGFIRTCEAP